MNFAILKYQFISDKPSDIPDAWPAETIKLGESTELPGSDWVLMTGEELETYLSNNQSAYDTWAVNINLEERKKNKIVNIDKKTTSIINAGFTFDSHVFSLSLRAQINWAGLVTLENLLTWPITITTITDGEYSLAQGYLLYFIGSGKNVIEGALNSGRNLKLAVTAATNQSELDAVVDSR